MEGYTTIAGEVFNGHSLSKNQMAAIEMSIAMGNSYPQNVMDVFNKQKNNSSEAITENQSDNNENSDKKRGGSCSSDSSSSQESSSDTPIMDLLKLFSNTPDNQKVALDIIDNDIPENWWDKLPDFDPRVYDAIMMEQAESCVNYIFENLPNMHELENKIESNKFRKTCSRLKTQVPRTKLSKPTEIKYDIQIDNFVNKF